MNSSKRSLEKEEGSVSSDEKRSKLVSNEALCIIMASFRGVQVERLIYHAQLQQELKLLRVQFYFRGGDWILNPYVYEGNPSYKLENFVLELPGNFCLYYYETILITENRFTVARLQFWKRSLECLTRAELVELCELAEFTTEPPNFAEYYDFNVNPEISRMYKPLLYHLVYSTFPVCVAHTL